MLEFDIKTTWDYIRYHMSTSSCNQTCKFCSYFTCCFLTDIQTPADEQDDEESNSDALSTAEIIGAVVGVVAVVVLVITIGLCVKRHRESFDVGDQQDLQDASSVASSHGYTNSNFTSAM